MMSDTTHEGQRITVRALILGLVTVVGFTVAGCFSVLLRYEIIGTGYLPRGALALLMVFVILNGLVGLVSRRLKLSRNEMLLIFIMLLAMAAIPGQEYAQHFYLNILGIVYYTTPDIAKPEIYLDDLNPALVPSVDRESPEINWAFEGVPPGSSVPYRAWLRPLLVWTPYFFALYWMLLCGAAILAARWEDHEKLLYPLMQVPNEMTESGKGFVSSLMRDKMMWICFAICCVLYIIKGLHSYFPTIPDINLQQTTQRLVAGGPGVVFNNVALHIYPEMIGIAYLLTSEVGFSLWFFYIFRLIQAFFRNLIGIQTNHYPFFEYQTAGGYIVLALALLWSARRHIAHVFGVAFGLRREREEDRGQPYRLAAIGFVVSFAVILLWAQQIGMSMLWAVVLFALIPLIGMVVARVICEAGMFIYSSPFRLNEMIFRVAGSQRIGAENITLMTAASWVQVRSTATQFMPQAFQGLKLSSLANMDRGKMLLIMGLAVAVAILTSHVVCPYVIYTWSVPKLGWWPSGSSLGTTKNLVSFILNPSEMRIGDWASMAGGGLTTVFLVFMRQRFLWWPFHPAGFIAWLGWPVERYWMSILLGWLTKTVVLRFFGFKAFASLRPAAFGFILGICFILTFWLVFHFFIEGPPLLIE
ncbi:MAG: hypothetical protein HPY44_15405 [Armatimonadetes bacterium]|nr:hypothetical protein [Armatimonadota bacterium]